MFTSFSVFHEYYVTRKNILFIRFAMLNFKKLTRTNDNLLNKMDQHFKPYYYITMVDSDELRVQIKKTL